MLFLNKFNIKPMRKLEDSWVAEEFDNLNSNIIIFRTVTEFFVECYQAYKALINQLDDLLFSHKEFTELRQYISRARMNLSNLSNTLKNHENNFIHDTQVNKELIKA